MIAGEVGKIREFDRGVEADVCIGMTAEGVVVVRVTGSSKRTKRALSELKAALKEDAHNAIVAAQELQTRRGRKAIGVEA